MNRPETRNAIDMAMGSAVDRAVAAAEQDEAVRVIRLTGSPRAGEPCRRMYYNGLQVIATRAGNGKIDDQHPPR